MKLFDVFWIFWNFIRYRRKTIFICYIIFVVLCSTLAQPEAPEEFSWPHVCKFYSDKDCKDLPNLCLNCHFEQNCNYGDVVDLLCDVKGDIKCKGAKVGIARQAECKYCWQTEGHVCKPLFNCSVWAAPPQQMQKTVCWANDKEICMGNRAFYKQVRCNWTSGYKWSTALVLSITLGGFGADRFYLGLWQSGLGKLFSFGGVGVWTLIDVILIGTGYVGPADKSVYMP